VPFTHGKLYYTLEQAIDAIQDVVSSARQPFVAYFHMYPPHFPYKTRHEFVNMFSDGWAPVAKEPNAFSAGIPDDHLNQLRREYDEFIAYADAEFGRLYDSLVQAGVLDNTYAIVTSDHGELFERGVWEHLTPLLYEPLIHIPLVISRPKQPQREDVYVPTTCVDLLPTLMHITGQVIPYWCEGKVLPGFDGLKGDNHRRDIFSVEAKINRAQAPLTQGTVALIKDQYKLIHYFGYDGIENAYELYDVVNDPEEVENLYLSRRSVATELQRGLSEKLQTVNELHLK
jgi:arylsulfatase A-like enzyme